MERTFINPRLLQILADKNILFVMHTRVTHFLEIFRDFTSPKCRNYSIIDHPLHPLKGTESKFIIYNKKTVHQKRIFSRIPGPYTVNFIKDFFLTIWWGLSAGVVYDVGIGANNLNTLALLVLRKLGRVRKVIFMCIDYSPNRYDNPVLDWIYHWIDRVCCYYSNVIWNSSGRMNEARAKNGVDQKRIAHTIVMPDGSNFDSRKRLPIGKIDRRKLIYCGHMRAVMGIELILVTFKELLKTIPDTSLLLIGGGPELEKYKARAGELGLGKKAVFTGFLQSHAEVDSLVAKGAVGLSLFAPDKSSYEYYSDVGKPKVYLAAGLPVIITRVPEIADIIENKHAGIVVSYNKLELLLAMKQLLLQDAEYGFFRRNAIRLSKSYIWNNIFADVYRQTWDYLEKKS